jgi:hypothetical protein
MPKVNHVLGGIRIRVPIVRSAKDHDGLNRAASWITSLKLTYKPCSLKPHDQTDHLHEINL